MLMRNRIPDVAAAALVFILLFSPAQLYAGGKTLLIGLIPEVNIFKQKERYRAIGEYLGRKTGVEVKFTVLSRYGNIIEKFRKEHMDGAFFGSFTGAAAIQQLHLIPLVRPVNRNGSSHYWGYLFVRKDSNIHDVRGMKGKRMAFVEKATTAGFVFPLYYLKEHGVSSYQSFFREYYFTGSHDAAIYAVLDGQADIGVAKNSVYDRIRKEDPNINKELLVIAESVHVPENGLLVRGDLDRELIKNIKEALLTLDSDAEGQKVLREFGAIRFIETTEEDYSSVYSLAKKAGIDIKHYKWSNK